MTTVTALGISFDLDKLSDLAGAAVETAADNFPPGWSAPLAATTARTYYSALKAAAGQPETAVQRSAVLWDLRSSGRAELEALAQNDGTADSERNARILIEIAQDYDELRGRDLGAIASPAASARKAANPDRERPQGHRKRLTRLPGSWLQQLFAATRHLHHKRALAVSILTGCRPSALERGVKVSLEDTGLVIERAGEKGARGETIRAVFAPHVGPFATWLADSLANRTGNSCTVQVPVRTFEDFLKRLASTVLGAHVTPMVIRAQVIADLKAEGTPRGQIVDLVGQLSERYLSRYGTAHQSGPRRGHLRAVHRQQDRPTPPEPGPAATAVPSKAGGAVDEEIGPEPAPADAAGVARGPAGPGRG